MNNEKITIDAKHVFILTRNEMNLLDGNHIYDMLNNKVVVNYKGRDTNIISYIKSWINENVVGMVCVDTDESCSLHPECGTFTVFFKMANYRSNFINWINSHDAINYPEADDSMS